MTIRSRPFPISVQDEDAVTRNEERERKRRSTVIPEQRTDRSIFTPESTIEYPNYGQDCHLSVQLQLNPTTTATPISIHPHASPRLTD